MNKRIKKLTTVVLCAAMLAVAAPVGVFADSITPSKSVHAEYKPEKGRITGTIDLSEYITVDGSVTNNEYKGNIFGEISSTDLIEDAYQAYLNNFKGKWLLSGPAENLVMFGAGYIEPFATLKITLPEGVKIDKNTFSSNSKSTSSTVSKIYCKDGEPDNVMTIIFNLGTWNDYNTFFTNYEKEREDSRKTVKIDIPFSYNLGDKTYEAGDSIGTVSSKGECKLYYGGRFKSFYKTPIVDISTREITKEILYK